MTAGDAPTHRSRAAFWLGTVPVRVLAAIACLLLFGLVVLTFADVLGRDLLGRPLPAAHEIISFAMPGIIFCALPTVCLREGHVTIDLLDGLIPRAWKRWQGLFVNLIGAGVMSFIGWRLAVRSHDHHRFDEATDELYLSLWPFSLFMAVLSIVAALALLGVALGYLTGARREPSSPHARS